MTGMDVRALRPEDEPVLDDWMDPAAEQFLGRRPSLDSPTEHSLSHAVIGLDDGVPKGVVWFQFYAGDEAHVSMLVPPYARRRGIGRRVLRASLAATTATIIKADVLPGNDAAASVLLAADFTEIVPPDSEERDGRFFVWTRDGRAYEPRWL
jgi:ribosomal protein S18 acetylase RimI-like enzyme